MNCFRADAPVPLLGRSEQLSAKQSNPAGVRALMSVNPLEGARTIIEIFERLVDAWRSHQVMTT
jgi:hypothetical protein